MGTTGSSAQVAMNSALPNLLSRVRESTLVPLAVGFGVATRDHFETVARAGADGVVIGSRIVSIIKDAPADQVAATVRDYCQEISHKGHPSFNSKVEQAVNAVKDLPSPAEETAHGIVVPPPLPIPQSDGPAPSKDLLAVSEAKVLPGRFGQFGGQYVPEALVESLMELEEAHKQALADPAFWKEFEGFYGYMNRPSRLYLAERLTEHAGGAKIWLKREDLYVIQPCCRAL